MQPFHTRNGCPLSPARRAKHFTAVATVVAPHLEREISFAVKAIRTSRVLDPRYAKVDCRSCDTHVSSSLRIHLSKSSESGFADDVKYKWQLWRGGSWETVEDNDYFWSRDILNDTLSFRLKVPIARVDTFSSANSLALTAIPPTL